MILHIAQQIAWKAAQKLGEYRPESLETEGFIHCSTPEQLLIPANALFRGQSDLVLLVIDPAQLQTPIVYEDCYATGIAFPHIYGPLPVTAVLQVLDFLPQQDGTFVLPPQLAGF